MAGRGQVKYIWVNGRKLAATMSPLFQALADLIKLN